MRVAHPLTGFAMDQSAPDVAIEVLKPDPGDAVVTLHVCVTCRAGEEGEDSVRPGRRLHGALTEAATRLDGASSFRIVEVECLSNCNRGCSAALTGPGRWSYIYGDLNQACVDDLLTGASRYAATADGLVPWRGRPGLFRQGARAAMPPT